MKRLKLKLFLLIFGLVLYFIISNANNFYKEKFIQAELNTAQKELRTNYDIISHTYQNIADSIFFSISNSSQIKHILKQSLDADTTQRANLRDQLYKLTSQQYEGTLNLGLKLILFSNPNNKVFLRTHKPDQFDDDISTVRYSIVQTNKIYKVFRGFEAGKHTHAFRNVYPIFNNQNQYLGCVDIGFSSEYLQDTLNQVHKIHTHFLVDKYVINDKLWETSNSEGKYRISMEDEHFAVSIRKDAKHELKDISKSTIKANQEIIHTNLESAKEFSIYGYTKDVSVVISFLPIFDVSKSAYPAAYVVSYIKNTKISDIIKNHTYINILIILFIILLLMLIYQTLASKEDLQNEVLEKTKKLQHINDNLEEKIKHEIEKNRRNEFQLLEQSKNASMGEMIGNIAHQWRQPLSAITSTASSVNLQNQLGTLCKEEITSSMNNIVNKANYLSETINTFRNFLKVDKEKKEFFLENSIKKSLHIIEATLKDYHIELIADLGSSQTQLFGIESELSQVLINIINNAKDVFKEKNIENATIEIKLITDQEKAVISIEDNGGGVPEQILAKIFDPYFTTKHQSQGTGLGLHMSYRIISESFNGKLFVENTKRGAKFIMELPFKKIAQK